MRSRQQLLRALVTDIIADIDEDAREVILTVHWRGGQHSQLRVRKPKSGEHGCRTPEDALAVMRSMAARWSDADIAASLNRMGMRTGQGKSWTAHRVSSLRRVHGIRAYRSAEKNGEWLTLSEAAAKLGVSHHRPACPPVGHDAGPLRLLWRDGEQSTGALVCPPGCADLATMAVATGSSERLHLDAFDGIPEAAPAAATLLEALNRHRGKGHQKVTVEHVHVHQGGQAIVGSVETGGGVLSVNQRTTPCTSSCPCTSHPVVERRPAAAAHAARRRCRTGDAACTGAGHRAHRRVSAMAVTKMAGSPTRPFSIGAR